MIFNPTTLITDRFMSAVDKIKIGTLTVILPDGSLSVVRGTLPGPEATFHIRDWSVLKRLALRGDIAMGEDYISGKWDTDNIENLISVFLLNLDHFEAFAHGNWFSRLMFRIYNHVIRKNDKRGSSKNIQSHYDVGNAFYRLWLDDSMTYSSALYRQKDMNLERAQHAKYQRILDRLDYQPGSLLEIGCGWGGFATQASERVPHITGLTISPSQYAFARDRLHTKADIRLQDYRDVQERFDAIVSIEMFEAVGERYWPQYFRTIAQSLRKGGKAIIQTITVRDEHFDTYRTRSDFIRHYVFPGGMLPSLKRFREEASKAGLKCMDTFSFGQDYARTLSEWLTRFNTQHHNIRKLGYNDAFIRNWQFYLSICAAAFAVERTNVVQLELAHA